MGQRGTAPCCVGPRLIPAADKTPRLIADLQNPSSSFVPQPHSPQGVPTGFGFDCFNGHDTLRVVVGITFKAGRGVGYE